MRRQKRKFKELPRGCQRSKAARCGEELCHLLLCQLLLNYALFYQFSYCCVISFCTKDHCLMREGGQCLIPSLAARVAHVIERQLT